MSFTHNQIVEEKETASIASEREGGGKGTTRVKIQKPLNTEGTESTVPVPTGTESNVPTPKPLKRKPGSDVLSDEGAEKTARKGNGEPSSTEPVILVAPGARREGDEHVNAYMSREDAVSISSTDEGEVSRTKGSTNRPASKERQRGRMVQRQATGLKRNQSGKETSATSRASLSEYEMARPEPSVQRAAREIVGPQASTSAVDTETNQGGILQEGPSISITSGSEREDLPMGVSARTMYGEGGEDGNIAFRAPPSVGKIAAMMRKAKALAKTQREGKVEEAILDPMQPVTHNKRTIREQRRTDCLLQHMKTSSTQEITEAALEGVDTVRKATQMSKNLKGTVVKGLWQATSAISASLLALDQRARIQGAVVSEEEWEGVRRENAHLKSELERMRGDTALIRAELATTRQQLTDLQGKLAAVSYPVASTTGAADNRSSRKRVV